MTKLERLYIQQSKKFDQLCTLVALELGYSEFSALGMEELDRIKCEAEHYYEEWQETVEMTSSLNIRLVTPLRRCLAEYHVISEGILDELEMVAGLSACRRRYQKHRRPASKPLS
jgi:hypothetical protein